MKWWGMARFWTIGSYVAALLIFGISARVSVQGAATTLASFAILSLGGVVFLRHLVPTIESRLCILAFGPLVGLVFGRFTLLLTGLAFGPSAISAAAAHGLVAGAAILLAAMKPRSLPAWGLEDRRELDWILGVSAAVLVAMAISYWRVGAETEKGYAFAPYFSLDFFNHIGVTAEVAREVPPQSPYFAGEHLHYYWFFHLWPAAIMNLAGVSAREGFVLSLPGTALVFVGALAALISSYEPKLRPRYLAVGLGVLAFSYIGLLFVAKQVASHWFASVSRYANVDYSFLSHSWFRDFLYEPHAATAVSLLAFVIYLNNRPATRVSSVVAGLILGSVAVTDVVVGMSSLAWFGAKSIWPFLRDSRERGLILLSGLACLAVVAGGFALDVFPRGSGVMQLSLHPAAKYGPIYLLLDLGPLFLFGAVGLYLCLRRGLDASLRSIALLLTVALGLAFLLNVEIEPNHMIRKSIKVVELALVVFAALACSRYVDLPHRHWLRIGGGIAILAGFVTLCTDLIQYVDLDLERRPGTLYMSSDKKAVLDWLRTHTQKDAIVQLLDEVRPGQELLSTGYVVNAEFDNSIPGLAERRTLHGNLKWNRVTHVGDKPLEERRAILERVFLAADGTTLKKCLDSLPRCYLVLDCSAPGPVKAVQELVVSGYLEEVFQAGKFRVLLETDHRENTRKSNESRGN
jgi:hypothetical protein